MFDFNHKFLCHVKKVSQRMQKDGEVEVLAVDVMLRIMMDIGSEWDAVLGDLIDSRVLAFMPEMTQALDKLPFSAAFTEIDVTFEAVEEVITTLRGAKVCKFVFDCGDAGITFHVQCETDGPTIGLLSELMNTKIMVKMDSEQGQLDLG